jgi:hypothetical protein
VRSPRAGGAGRSRRSIFYGARGQQGGLHVRFWNTTSKWPWPFERADISLEQLVVPCCLVGDPDVPRSAPHRHGPAGAPRSDSAKSLSGFPEGPS